MVLSRQASERRYTLSAISPAAQSKKEEVAMLRRQLQCSERITERER